MKNRCRFSLLIRLRFLCLLCVRVLLLLLFHLSHFIKILSILFVSACRGFVRSSYVVLCLSCFSYSAEYKTISTGWDITKLHCKLVFFFRISFPLAWTVDSCVHILLPPPLLLLLLFPCVCVCFSHFDAFPFAGRLSWIRCISFYNYHKMHSFTYHSISAAIIIYRYLFISSFMWVCVCVCFTLIHWFSSKSDDFVLKKKFFHL